jgi:hypothetical protein
MLSRENYAGILVELLGRVFTPLFRLQQQQQQLQQQQQQQQTVSLKSASMEIDDDVLPTHPYHLPSATDSLQGLSHQIAAGMWKILTQNVDLLPLLSLEQWECLFKIIAFGSNSGSFAAFKSFEVMAWLLHEPRLFASVPVFCIIAVKPLVYNKQAPIFVSTGAVKLLKYLHSRLEAIIHDSYKTKEDKMNNTSGNTGNNNNQTEDNKGDHHSHHNHPHKEHYKQRDRQHPGDKEFYEELMQVDETSFAVWKVIILYFILFFIVFLFVFISLHIFIFVFYCLILLFSDNLI